MFKVTYIFLALCVCGCLGLSAQSAIGLDLQINRDFFELKDEAAGIKKSPRLNVSPGISYRYTFIHGFALYTGLRIKFYQESVSFRALPGTMSGSGNVALQVPLLAGWNFHALKIKKLVISPLLGGAFNVFLLDEKGESAGYMAMGSDSVRYGATSTTLKKTFITAIAGLSFEYRFSPGFSAGVFFQYTKGFVAVNRQDLSYHVNTDAETKAVQTNYGNYGTYLGFRVYRIFPRRIRTVNSEKNR